MRSFVFTLGFQEDFILQRLSRKAAQPGERVPVLTASPVVGGVGSAFNPLVEQCGRLGLSTPELVALDLTDEAWALAMPIRLV
ncbi:MAG: hypothetical protein QW324_08245 [Thermofilaceae archaeon]